MRSRADSELGIFEKTVLDFATHELVEGRQESDRFPFGPLFEGVLQKARAVGFFSATLPEDLGGAGLDATELCVLLDDLCRYDASLAGIIFTDTLAKEVVYRSRGSELLGDPPAKEGEYGDSLFAFQSHADPAECRGLSAEAAADGAYSLSGKAEYVVLGGLAGTAVLPVQTGPGGFSFFLVDLSGDDVERSEPVLSLGLHACPAVDLTLDGARGLMIGEPGEGATHFERVSGRMHAAAAAMSLGVMKGSFEEALGYAREREQGGRKIVDWSEVRRMLARMASTVKVADMLVSEACRAADDDEPGWEMGAKAAALYNGRVACELTTDGVQLLGGNGYMEDYGQEKRFRDAAQIRSLLGMATVREMEIIGRVLEGEPLY
jgi:alkylation response protein AidB-like acyl-CoA dehydrogenase